MSLNLVTDDELFVSNDPVFGGYANAFADIIRRRNREAREIAEEKKRDADRLEKKAKVEKVVPSFFSFDLSLLLSSVELVAEAASSTVVLDIDEGEENYCVDCNRVSSDIKYCVVELNDPKDVVVQCLGRQGEVVEFEICLPFQRCVSDVVDDPRASDACDGFEFNDRFEYLIGRISAFRGVMINFRRNYPYSNFASCFSSCKANFVRFPLSRDGPLTGFVFDRGGIIEDGLVRGGIHKNPGPGLAGMNASAFPGFKREVQGIEIPDFNRHQASDFDRVVTSFYDIKTSGFEAASRCGAFFRVDTDMRSCARLLYELGKSVECNIWEYASYEFCELKVSGIVSVRGVDLPIIRHGFSWYKYDEVAEIDGCTCIDTSTDPFRTAYSIQDSRKPSVTVNPYFTMNPYNGYRPLFYHYFIIDSKWGFDYEYNVNLTYSFTIKVSKKKAFFNPDFFGYNWSDEFCKCFSTCDRDCNHDHCSDASIIHFLGKSCLMHDDVSWNDKVNRRTGLIYANYGLDNYFSFVRSMSLICSVANRLVLKNQFCGELPDMVKCYVELMCYHGLLCKGEDDGYLLNAHSDSFLDELFDSERLKFESVQCTPALVNKSFDVVGK